jgi:hypothetical protein
MLFIMTPRMRGVRQCSCHHERWPNPESSSQEDVHACGHLAAIDLPSQMMLMDFDKAPGYRNKGSGLKARRLQLGRRRIPPLSYSSTV